MSQMNRYAFIVMNDFIYRYRYSFISLILVFGLGFLGQKAIIDTYLICVQGHFLLCYYWTLKKDRKAFLRLSMIAAVLLAIYFSPLSTPVLSVLGSLVFLNHFWRDELTMMPKDSWKSWGGAFVMASLLVLAVIIIMQVSVQAETVLKFWLYQLPTPLIFMLLVVFHVVRWFFQMHNKAKEQARTQQFSFLLAFVIINSLLASMYYLIEPSSSWHWSMFGARENMNWALLHMLYTYPSQNLKQLVQYA